MSQSKTFRTFTTAFKLEVIERIESGAAMASLSRDLGIRRKLLYDWHGSWKASGVDGLNRKRGPKPGGKRKLKPERIAAGRVSDLAQARARIGELERVIGRQQADLDFFRQALRVLDETVPQGKEPSASIRSSTP
jgi:transposase